MENILKAGMKFGKIGQALKYTGLDYSKTNKQKNKKLLSEICEFHYISKCSIVIDSILKSDFECNLNHIDEKYEKIYKVENDNELVKKSFIEFYTFCNAMNIELLSDYTGTENFIRFKYMSAIFERKVCNIKSFVNSIEIIEKNILENGDILLYLNSINNIPYLHIKTFDNGFIDICETQYKKFAQGRERFFLKLKTNGDVALSPYISATKEIAIQYRCGHIPQLKTPNAYTGICSVCANRSVQFGVNDIYTQKPELLKYFSNINDAFTHTLYSNKKLVLKCPNCGSEKYISPAHLNYFGFSCDFCNEITHYPNKFMNILLRYLEIEYICEFSPNWCVFTNPYRNKKQSGRYDFYIPSKNIIIEMDGLLHYSDNLMNNTKLEETKYIDEKKNILAKENNIDVVRIPCVYKTKKERNDVIFKSIIDSNLIEKLEISFQKFSECFDKTIIDL